MTDFEIITTNRIKAYEGKAVNLVWGALKAMRFTRSEEWDNARFTLFYRKNCLVRVDYAENKAAEISVKFLDRDWTEVTTTP